MSDNPNSRKNNVLHVLEWILVFIGAAVCLVVVFLFSSQQPNELWPFPGLYFLEITLLTIFGAGSRLFASNQTKPILLAAPWITGGALIPMIIVGALTIGVFLLPAMLAFILSGIIADIHLKKGYVGHLSISAMTALIQAAFMIVVYLI